MSLFVDVANSGCFQLWMPQAVDLKEAENNGYRALAGRRTLTAAQNMSVLRGLGGIKFSDNDVAGLYDRFGTGRLKEDLAWW